MATGKKVSPFTLDSLNKKAAMEKRQKLNASDPGLSTIIPRAMRSKRINETEAGSGALIKKYGGDAAKSRGFMSYEKPGDRAAKTTMQRVVEETLKPKAKAKPAMSPNRAKVAKKKP